MRIHRVVFALAMLTALTGKGDAVSLEIISPAGTNSEVATPTINVALRLTDFEKGTTYSALIGETTVPVFSTGIAVRDFVPVAMGANKISVAVVGHESQTSKTLTIMRKESLPKPAIRPTDRKFLPAGNTQLPAGETVEVGFDETSGGQGEVNWGGQWKPLFEEANPVSGRSMYRGEMLLSDGAVTTNSATSDTVEMRYRAKPADTWTTLRSKGRVLMLDGATRRMVKTKNDRAPISFGLTEVRLGGPFISEVSSNTVFEVTGQVGTDLRVALGETNSGWVSVSQTVPLASNHPKPHLEFVGVATTITATGDESLSVAYPEVAPYAVKDVMSADGKPEIHIDFYGAHPAATWISHQPNLAIIKHILLEQPAPDVVRLRVLLNEDRLWGYRTEIAGGTFKVTVRKGPEFDRANPLAGLTFAIEAGHGGTDNGARGLAGTREKDINRQVSDVLEKQLIAKGATVIQTRVGDTNPGRDERADRATDANAHFFISIHCNSAGSHRGYLGVKGNSTLYKHPFNHELNTIMHQTIMKETGLESFGIIANFNYTPVRLMTWMPSVLVEQAFISNPKEEEMFNTPEYQEQMARGIVLGIEEYLAKPGKH